MGMAQPMLFADVLDVEAKIPLPLISGGTHKLTSILLGIASQPKGVVMVDEIENGFYFKTMPRVWESIVAFAKEYDVQLILATHSKEWLQAANAVIKENAEDFKLIRLEHKDNRRAAKVFSGEELEAAMETGGEF